MKEILAFIGGFYLFCIFCAMFHDLFIGER